MEIVLQSPSFYVLISTWQQKMLRVYRKTKSTHYEETTTCFLIKIPYKNCSKCWLWKTPTPPLRPFRPCFFPNIDLTLTHSPLDRAPFLGLQRHLRSPARQLLPQGTAVSVWTASSLTAMAMSCFYLPCSYPVHCEARGRYSAHKKRVERKTHRK